MKAYRISLATAAMLLAFSVSACAGASSQSGTKETSDRSRSEHLSTVSAKDFDRADFDDDSARVDNKWFPLVPGAYSVFEGSALDDGERVSRRVLTTVTDLTKVIDGVNAMVVWERDYTEGEEVEAELAFFAQDIYGSVWYFGEDTKAYENGKVVSTKGPWEAGVDGAKPGILMQADPKVGQSYFKEHYPGEAMDTARVLSSNASVTVPYGSFDHVLETKEWTPLQPGFSERKCYVRGVGPLGNPNDIALLDIKHR
jgi:hypothetical protein